MNTIINSNLPTNILTGKKKNINLKNGIAMQQHYNSAIAFGAKIPKLNANDGVINLGKKILNSIKNILTKSELPEVLDPVVVADIQRITNTKKILDEVKNNTYLSPDVKDALKNNKINNDQRESLNQAIGEIRDSSKKEDLQKRLKFTGNEKNIEHNSDVSDTSNNMDGTDANIGNNTPTTVDFDDIAPVDLHTGIAEHLGNSSDLVDAVANGADVFSPITDHAGDIASDHASSVADAVHENVGEHVGNVISDHSSVIDTVHDIATEHGSSIIEKIIDIFTDLF